MANELDVAKQWLYATLHGDAQLLAAAPGDVWQDMADEGTDYPLVTFSYLGPFGGGDTSVVNGIRVMSRQLWTVKVTLQVGEADPAVAVGRIDAVLHRASGAAGTGRVLWSERQRPISYPEVDNGVLYRHEGGVYLLLVKDPA